MKVSQFLIFLNHSFSPLNLAPLSLYQFSLFLLSFNFPFGLFVDPPPLPPFYFIFLLFLSFPVELWCMEIVTLLYIVRLPLPFIPFPFALSISTPLPFISFLTPLPLAPSQASECTGYHTFVLLQVR